MANLIVIAVVLIVLALAALYIVREKKKGHKCIGCPYSGQCGGGCAHH